jgi:hypothetical protein
MGARVPPPEHPPTIGRTRRPASAVPKSPGRLSADETRWWRTLWREPIAATWETSDRMAVRALCRALAGIEAAATPPPGLLGQAQNAMASLALNPRGRGVLRIRVEGDDEPAPSARDAFRLGGERNPRPVTNLDQQRAT